MATEVTYFHGKKSGRVSCLVHYGASTGFHAYVLTHANMLVLGRVEAT